MPSCLYNLSLAIEVWHYVSSGIQDALYVGGKSDGKSKSPTRNLHYKALFCCQQQRKEQLVTTQINTNQAYNEEIRIYGIMVNMYTNTVGAAGDTETTATDETFDVSINAGS